MSYKLSNYLYITNETIDNHGKDNKIVYSLISGAILFLDSSLVEDLLESKFSNLSDEYISVLFENKIIVENNFDEFDFILKENIEFNLNSHNKLGLTLQPTSNCQLDCSYCGQVHKKHNLDIDVRNQLKEYVFKKLSSTSTYKNLLITWYGGEPLLSIGNIRSLSRDFIEYCRINGINYSAKIITNGVNLKKDIYYELVNLKIADFQITLDGIEEVHDSRRFLKNTQKGSFQIIYKNILDIVNSEFYNPNKGIIKIRINVDSNNSDSVVELLNLFIKDNIQGKISVYFSPVYDWGEVQGSKKSLSKEEYANLEIELLLFMYNNGFNIHIESLLPKRNPTVCMAVDKSQEVVDANGNIYPCWEFPYTPKYEIDEYKIGNIRENNLRNNDAKTRNWYIDGELEKYWCKGCRFLPVCGGGCPKQWYDDQPPCPSFKYNLEERLILYYLERQQVICR